MSKSRNRSRLSLERLEDRLAPATHTWTGAANDGGLWSTAGNWQADFAPAANETDVDLVFPSGPSGDALTSTNDLVFANGVRRIDVSGSGYQIGGVGITLLEAINGVGTEIGLDVTLGADARLDAVSVTGGIDLNGNVLTFGTNAATIGGVIGGDGEVQVNFANVTLSGDNTFTGPVSIGPFGGIVTAAHPNALGATGAGNDTVITFNTNDIFRRGGELRLTGGIVVPEDVVANGQGSNNGAVQSIDGDNTLTGTITGTASFSVAAGTQLTLERVAGTGLIVGAGGGTLRLAGTQANTYTGLTAMAPGAGTLLLDKPAGVAAIPGGRVLVNSATTLRLNADNQIGDGTDIDVRAGLLGSPGGVFDLNGRSDAIGSLGGAGGPAPGEVRLGEGELSVLDSVVEGGIGEFAGRLVGTAGGRLQVRGDKFRFSGDASDFLGAVEVTTGGVLDVQGELPSATLRGGTVQGTGTIGTLGSGPEGGVVSPGNSPGTLAIEFANLGREVRLLFEVAGSSSFQRDKIVFGDLRINDAVLDFLFEGADEFQIGDTITIAQALATNSVVMGQFADLPDGTVFQAGGKDLKIVYTADEVTVTVVPPDNQRVPTTTTLAVSTLDGFPVDEEFTINDVTVLAESGVVNEGSVTVTVKRNGVATRSVTRPVENGRARFRLFEQQTSGVEVTAEYSGSPAFQESSDDATVAGARDLGVVVDVKTTPNPSQPGQPVTITASVTDVPSILGGIAFRFATPPTGTVTFFLSFGSSLPRQLLGTAPLVPGEIPSPGLGTDSVPAGIATLVVDQFPPGEVTVVAEYSGDVHYKPGRDSTLHSSPDGRQASVTEASLSPKIVSQEGQLVTVTVRVRSSSGEGTPTGTVGFFGLDRTLGTAPVGPDGTASITFPAPDFESRKFVIDVNYSGDVAFAPSLAQAVLDVVTVRLFGTKKFVDELFRRILGRPAGSSAQEGLPEQLDSGRLNAFELAADLINSDEGRTFLVRKLYMEILDREPDPSGLAAHLAFLQNGGTVDDLRAILLASPEFFERFGGGTNEGFLQALYQKALGREVDLTGAAFFGGALAAGANRFAVALAVLRSAEGRTVLTEQTYNELLDRGSDAGGLAHHVGLLLAGNITPEQLVAALAGSLEFAQRALGQ